MDPDDGFVEEDRKHPKQRLFPTASGFYLLGAPGWRGCGRPGEALLYLLLLLTFLVCIILFSVTLVKYSELSAEMKSERLSAFNLSQDLVSAMTKSSADLKTIIDFMCKLCPIGWLSYNETCYLFSTTALTHRLAKQACHNHVANLVIIDNLEEQSFLAQNSNNKGYWIDLSDAGREGKWHWGDGSPLTFSSWNTGEPNDDKGKEDCAEMLSSGKWNDLPCTNKYNWICEKQGSC